jgi:hypothetical protein
MTWGAVRSTSRWQIALSKRPYQQRDQGVLLFLPFHPTGIGEMPSANCQLLIYTGTFPAGKEFFS